MPASPPWWVQTVLSWMGLLLCACSAVDPSREPATDSCAAASGADMGGATTAIAASLRSGVARSPLFAVARGTSSLAACELQADSGTVTIRYGFVDGSRLRVTRDDRIEYAEQELRLATPPLERPADILARAEQAAFGAVGCGIDYARGEIEPAADEAGAVETVFRGRDCNCQARIRRASSGRVVGLTLRSSC